MIQTPPITLGTGPIGRLDQPSADRDAAELVHYALERGAAFFDTAPMYGGGEAERRLGLALQGVPRDSYIVSTKVGRLLRHGGYDWDFSRDGVLRSLESSLKRLKLDRVDIVHLHDADDLLGPAVAQAFPALAELRAQGVIRAIGSGMNQWERQLDLAEFCEFDCFLLAGRYTLLQQTALPFLEVCLRRGIAVFTGGNYNSGILATGAVSGARYMYLDAPPRIVERTRSLEAICAGHRVALGAAALQFTRSHPAVTSLVIGAADAREFEQALTHLQARIPVSLWQDLRGSGLIDREAPLPGDQDSR